MSFKLTPQQRTRADELWQNMVDGKVQELDLIYEVIYLRDRVEGLESFKRGVDEALNSGDGSYRP